MDNGQFLQELGRRIRVVRKPQGITLDRLSELTGIARDNLSHIEYRGKNAHILTLKAIADCLGVDGKELL